MYMRSDFCKSHMNPLVRLKNSKQSTELANSEAIPSLLSKPEGNSAGLLRTVRMQCDQPMMIMDTTCGHYLPDGSISWCYTLNILMLQILC